MVILESAMKKNERIAAFVEQLDHTEPEMHPCYTGYFTCFNQQQYYEAHDVLEALWLPSRGSHEAPFYKGLIQFAGALVHLRKQFERPSHRCDGARLRPAARLFRLAAHSLAPFAPIFERLDVSHILALCAEFESRLELAEFLQNPWSPETAPRLSLL